MPCVPRPASGVLRGGALLAVIVAASAATAALLPRDHVGAALIQISREGGPASGQTAPDYEGPPMLATGWPADDLLPPPASAAATSSGIITATYFARCPEIASVLCPAHFPSHKTLLATDDAGGLYISVSGGVEGEGWTWDYYWPVNDPDDGTREAFGPCPTKILPASHPDNDGGEVALVAYCSYPGGPPNPHAYITFPDGCPCSFTFAVFPVISGEGVGLPPNGAFHPGTWEIHIHYTSPSGVTTPDVVVDTFYLKAVPAILLVHGYGSSCQEGMYAVEPWLESNLVDAAAFPYTATYDAPQRVECFDPPGGKPPPNDRGYDWAKGTITLGWELWNHIEGVDGFIERTHPARSGQIDIVAHSYGGLISRWYIEKNRAGNAPVRSLTMLGTPNLGTAAAHLALLKDFGPCLLSPALCIADAFDGGTLDDQGAWDMSLPSALPGGVLSALNSGWAAPTTAYRVQVGDVPALARLPWSAVWKVFFLASNDCLVPVDSAKGPFPPTVPVVWGNIAHPSTCETPSVNNDPSSNCSGDANHVFCNLNTALGIPVLPGPPPPPAPPPAPQGQAAREFSPQPAGPAAAVAAGLGITAGHVGPGGLNTHTAPIDGSAAGASFALSWRNDSGSTLHLTLVTPSGGTINASGPGVTYAPAVSTGDGALMEAFVVDSPEDGNWTMRVEAVSVPPEGEIYVVTAPMDSPVTMSTSVSAASVSPGDPVGMTAVLKEGSTPITGATVSVTVTKPDGSTQPVSLLDDGTGGDATPNDGIYFGTFADISACGIYVMDFEATGTSSAGTFTRSDVAFVESCADSDGDGCADSEEVGSDETLGGRRDPSNPWDFYDVPLPVGTPGTGSKNKSIDLDDILAVVAKFGSHPTNPPGAPLYDIAYDRGAPTADPWDAQPPMGAGVGVIFDDILWSVAQFGHSCVLAP